MTPDSKVALVGQSLDALSRGDAQPLQSALTPATRIRDLASAEAIFDRQSLIAWLADTVARDASSGSGPLNIRLTGQDLVVIEGLHDPALGDVVMVMCIGDDNTILGAARIDSRGLGGLP